MKDHIAHTKKDYSIMRIIMKMISKIKPVNLKGNQACVFIVRTDAEADNPVLWPPDAMSWLIGEDPDAGKDWGGEQGDRGWDG